MRVPTKYHQVLSTVIGHTNRLKNNDYILPNSANKLFWLSVQDKQG
jgi:hypothetical protein